MVVYGQVVIGPPGAGKTTYCNGMQQYLRLIGREALVVNLDPANEGVPSGDDNDDDDDDSHKNTQLPYDTIVDVCADMVNLSSVMEELELGPNGGLVYCMEYLERHVDHLVQLIRTRLEEDHAGEIVYLLFDLPGQVELYTHSSSVHTLIHKLTKELSLQLCLVQLVDSHYCMDATKFISAALLSTTSMIRLELPTVNVLSKIDLISKQGGLEESGLPYNLDFFTDCQDLDRLVDYVDSHPNDEEEYAIYGDDEGYRAARQKTLQSNFSKRHRKMHRLLCEVIDDYSLLSYMPLHIEDAESVGRVVSRIDKCNGYVFLPSKREEQKDQSSSSSAMHDMFQCAVQNDDVWKYESMANVHERYLGNTTFRDVIPELQENKKGPAKMSTNETKVLSKETANEKS